MTPAQQSYDPKKQNDVDAMQIVSDGRDGSINDPNENGFSWTLEAPIKPW